MLKKIILIALGLFLTAPLALAHHLPQENWAAMHPTVQVTSFKYKFSGHVVPQSSGSGTFISPEGLILTNNHVIFDEEEQKPLDAFEICITFDVKKEPLCNYTANLVAQDKEIDLAILKLNAEDVLGNSMPETFKFLDYLKGPEPQEKEEVLVVGHPASGGDTITITKGQISGYDTFNNFKYFKTDTDFDHGSSGGTVLSSQGEFIGIPTYIRSYAENVGYFLDLREARPWIEKNKTKKIKPHEKAEQDLKREMARFIEANKTLAYRHDLYPYLSLKLPKGWHFFETSDNHIAAAEKNVQEPVGLTVHVEYFPYLIDEKFLAKLNEQFIDTRRQFPDFKKENVLFSGGEAIRITYTSYNQKNTLYYIPYGYSIIGISYAINLDQQEKQWKALKPVLNSIVLPEAPQTNPGLPGVLSHDEPAFSIQAPKGWRLQKPLGGFGDLLVQGVQQDNIEGQFSISYRFIPKDEQELSMQEKLDDETKRIAEQRLKLITKKSDVRLDGLAGYLYTFEYEGELFQQIRRRSVMKLNHGQYEFILEYDDVSKNFLNNLSAVSEMLRSFKFLEKGAEGKGDYDFGGLGEQFKDIQHHRYSAAISDLAEKELIQGFADGRFRPEFSVRKSDALRLILESKNHLEKKKGLGKEVSFERKNYVPYARRKGILADGNFEPYASLTLGESLKWIMTVYEIPVWEGETKTLYKRYMDKGYELGLLPRELDDETHKLTRAELAQLVSTVYNQAK